MNREEALSVLNFQSGDPDEARDCYEEEIFQLIQVFLKDPVIPHLTEGRKLKIANLNQALSFFYTYQNLHPHLVTLTDLNKYSDWKSLWEAYERNKAALRKEMANTYEANNLFGLIDRLMENEKQYALVLTRYLTGLKENDQVKISERISVVDLLKECEILNNRGEIGESLESFKNLSDNLFTFNLSKEANRLRKLVKNG